MKKLLERTDIDEYLFARAKCDRLYEIAFGGDRDRCHGLHMPAYGGDRMRRITRSQINSLTMALLNYHEIAAEVLGNKSKPVVIITDLALYRQLGIAACKAITYHEKNGYFVGRFEHNGVSFVYQEM